MAIDENRLPELVVLALAFLASATSMWVDSARHRSLFNWVIGILVGLFFLISGVEFLAVVFWLGSTFTVVVERLFLIGFSSQTQPMGMRRKLAGCLVTLGALGLAYLGSFESIQNEFQVEFKPGLVEIGKVLIQSHGLAYAGLFVLALVVSVGVGVLAVNSPSEGRGESQT